MKEHFKLLLSFLSTVLFKRKQVKMKMKRNEVS